MSDLPLPMLRSRLRQDLCKVWGGGPLVSKQTRGKRRPMAASSPKKPETGPSKALLKEGNKGGMPKSSKSKDTTKGRKQESSRVLYRPEGPPPNPRCSLSWERRVDLENAKGTLKAARRELQKGVSLLRLAPLIVHL